MALPAKHEQFLRSFNPWWNEPGAIGFDYHIAQWADSKARYVPALFAAMRDGLDADKTVLYTVRGSRQVGKTTLAKLLIRDLLARDVMPMRVCYFSIGGRHAMQDLVQIILDYFDLTRLQHEDSRSYIFIDEISMIKDWQYAILELSNMRVLDNCALVVTGSNAIDLTRATESLIGRKGMVPGGNYRSLLPMGFLEYATVTSTPLRKFMNNSGMCNLDVRSTLWNKLVLGHEDQILKNLYMMYGEFDVALRQYVLSGGIPKITNQIMEHGSIKDNFYQEYQQSIMFEWSRMNYEQDRLKRYAEFVIRGIGGTISWNGMAKKLDIPNGATAEGYAMALRDMYVALLTYTYDERHDRMHYKKLKKIHVRDPFFLHALNAWSADRDYYTLATEYVSDASSMGHMAECILADHLARKALSKSSNMMQSAVSDRLFHWRDDAAREVDFVYREPRSTPVPIESKYVEHVDRRLLGGMSSFIDATDASRGIVATKGTYEIRRDYTAVPLSMLLLLLS